MTERTGFLESGHLPTLVAALLYFDVWLADRVGGSRLLLAVLGIAAMCLTLVAQILRSLVADEPA